MRLIFCYKLFQKRKDYNKSFNAVTILLLRMIFVYFLLNAKNKLHYMFLRKIHSFSTETSKFFNAWWDLILYAKLGIRNLLGISSTLLAWWLFNVNMIPDLWSEHFLLISIDYFLIVLLLAQKRSPVAFKLWLFCGWHFWLKLL